MPNPLSRLTAGLKDDCVFGLRQFRRHPGFSLSAILALALGISFSTTTFSFADALLYRPLDIPELDRFVQVGGHDPTLERSFRSITPSDFVDFREASQTLEGLAVSTRRSGNLTGAADPIQALGYGVSSGFFATTRVAPSLGRVFLPEEFTPGKNRSVILSHFLWRKQFGEDPGVLRRTIEIDGETHAIVGVMPKGFRFPQAVEYWTPLALNSQAWAVSSDFYLQCFGRLKPGVSRESAEAEIAAIAGRIAAKYPESHKGVSARVDLVRERISGDLTATYTRLSAGAVLFLLLIACANVANLQLARVLGRVKEVAIRGAMGAGSFRILRQILVESVMLAGAGALLGLPLSVWLLDLMKASMPVEVEKFLPGWQRMGLNREVLVLTALTALASGILAGLSPAWWLSRRSVSWGLSDSSRGSTSGGRQHLRAMLVITETALAVVLLAGAALMVKGFRNLSELPLNCDPDQILTWNIALPQTRYESPEKKRNFYRSLLDEIAGTPALSSVALFEDIPYGNSSSNRLFVIEGKPAPIGPQNVAQFQTVSERAFSTLGISILKGRPISSGDAEGKQEVAVVSKQFVDRYLPGDDPLGKRIRILDGDWCTIVGVAADSRQDNIERRPRAVIYRPYRQAPSQSAYFVVQAGNDPAQFASAVRAAVRRLDPVQPVGELQTFRRVITNAMMGFNYISSILATLGIVALFLATLGVYSLMAYTVGERTREIGIRMAFGASAQEVLRMVFRRGSVLAGIGLVIGLAGAFAVARLMAQVLFGVSATDPFVFIAVPAALALSLALACLLPARSAASTDPIVALREE